MAIYSRKSRFTGKGESVENQIDMCRQYIQAHYGGAEAENALVYEDEGFSGGNLERPQFKQMMADAGRKYFSAIVVYRLDRISRNIGDFAKLIEQLSEMHIAFISIKEQFDTGNPMGRAMMYISSVFSQLERETIAERIRDNMHELAKTGRWLGGTTPTGFASESVSYVTIDGKTRKACKLSVLPEEIQLVRLIYDKFLETGSLTQVDAYLLERRCLTKRGNPFTRFSIKNILTNPVYMVADAAAYDYLVENRADLFGNQADFDGIHGIMAYNRTIQQTGRAHQIRPMTEWIVAVGKHEGIIPGEQWVRVQKSLETNSAKAFRKARSHVALLSGILYCGHCGDYMRPKIANTCAEDGTRNYGYLCTTKERSRGSCCQMKNPDGCLLDAKIMEAVKNLGTENSVFAEALEKAKRILPETLDACETALETLRTELAANEDEIKALVQTLPRAAGTAAEAYILEQIQFLHRKNKELRIAQREAEALASRQKPGEDALDVLRKMLASFGESLDAMSLEQKRAVIRSVVRKVVWDGTSAHVYFFGGDEAPEP